MQTANAPLPLQGTKNTRELGGYPTKDGNRTKTHVFLRSDDLHDLTEPDETYLVDYGLRLDVDLRMAIERLKAPDRINRHEIEYVDISLLQDSFSDAARDLFLGRMEDIPQTMGGLYLFIAENSRAEIGEVLHLLIRANDCSLFHCTNGKDRTGIIAMLLLEMADVPEDTIIADYAASQYHVRPKYRAEHLAVMEEAGSVLPKDAFDSDPSFMEFLISALNHKYGSVLGYLGNIGITDDEVAQLKAKFVEPAAG